MGKLNNPCRNLIPAAVLAAFALPLICQPAHAGTPDFSRAVQGIETHYQIHRNYCFLMGFAGFIASVWRPGGVKQVKIALFENPRVLDGSNSEEFMNVIHAALQPEWQTFIRNYSVKDGERTWIFAKVPVSRHPRWVTVLIATMSHDDAVAIQASMDSRVWRDEVERVNPKKGSKTSYARNFLNDGYRSE